MEHDETAGTSSWKSRNCSLGPGEYAKSWSLTSTTADTQVLSRRVAMWIVILSRLVQTIIIISYNTFVSRVSSIVFGVLFGILSFLFVVWCLTVIDRAQGRRKLCGLAISRLHLDLFVVCCAVLHLVLLVGFWTFLGHISFNATWFGLWAFIALYGFICTKSPRAA